MNDLIGLAEPLTKLVEIFSKGCGILYEPTRIRRIAKAKTDEIKILSETIRLYPDMNIEYDNNGVAISSRDILDLQKRTSERLMYQEMKKQQNIESIFMQAQDELSQDQKVPGELPDEEWILRFFNSIEDVCNEDIQNIWGKVLAGEIRQPKSISLRTLEKLKNISTEEARLFEKYSSYVLSNGEIYFYLSSIKVNDSMGLKQTEIFKLDECGLFASDARTLTINVSTNYEIAIKNSEMISFVKSTKPNTELRLSVFQVTEVGKSLLSILKIKPDNDYLFKSLQEVSDNNKQVTFRTHKIVSINGNSIEYLDDVAFLTSIV